MPAPSGPPAPPNGPPPDPTSAWTPPDSTGVLEVDPEDLWAAARAMTGLRASFIGTCQGDTSSLAGTGDMAGQDYVGLYFSGLYDPVAQETVEALGDLMNSVAGVIDGLTVSANTYEAAEHASISGASGAARQEPVPCLAPETFTRPAPGSQEGYQDIQSIGANPVTTALCMPVKDPIATLTAWLPRGHQDRLITAAAAWRSVASAVRDLSDGLDRELDKLTVDKSLGNQTRTTGRYPGKITSNQVNSWRSSMVKFCARIWGRAPWGVTGLPSHPLGLAAVCADKLAAMCDQQRHAIDAARSALEHRITDAALATVIGLLLSDVTLGISDILAEMIDEDMVADCIAILVETYYRPIEQIEQTWDLLTVRAELQRALAAAPTIGYMEAQAESVGTRSLHDFSYPGMLAKPKPNSKDSKKKYSGWGDPGSMPAYPIDLAGQEGTSKSHIVEKHVGMTDQQLLHRVAGQNLAPDEGSSAFPTLGAAQTLITQDMNSPTNHQKMAAWLAGPRKPGDQITLTMADQNGPPTGRAVIEEAGGRHSVVTAHGVRAIVKYNNSLDPPYYVYTAFPTP